MSLQARLLNIGAQLVRRLRPHAAAVLRRTGWRTTAAAYEPPRVLDIGLERSLRHIGDVPVFTVRPLRRNPEAHVIYLHGGSYTLEINFWHWRLIRYLARAVPAQIQAPIYPLAPKGNAETTVAATTDVVAEVLAGHQNVTLIGDSAGAGLALAVAQKLRDNAQSQPAHIVLISPWLDVTVSDPQQLQGASRDLLQRIDRLRDAGRLYAGALDVRDPRVSPLHGTLSGLAPIHIFSGTRDILTFDARQLAARCQQVGQPSTLHEAAGMPHDYPLYPLMPAARAARQQIAQIVRG